MQDVRPEIRAEVAMSSMADVVRDAFSLGYVTPEWRAMSRRIYYHFRKQYDDAQREMANGRSA